MIRNSIDLSCTNKDENTYLLKLTVSKNAVGIIYKTTVALYTHGWNIIEAVAETISGGLVKDIFIIRHRYGDKMNDSALQEIKSELIKLICEDIDFRQYLEEIFLKLKEQCHGTNSSATVNLFNPPSLDSSVLDIKGKPIPEQLVLVSGLLFFDNLDILSLTVKLEKEFARYSFLLRTESGKKMEEEALINLKEQINQIL